MPTLPSETARKVLCSAKSKIPTPYSSSRDTSASILAESSSAKLYGQARFPFNTDCNADCGRSLKLLHFVRLSPRPPRSNTTRIAHRIDHGNSTRWPSAPQLVITHILCVSMSTFFVFQRGKKKRYPFALKESKTRKNCVGTSTLHPSGANN